ncbi:MAG: STAS domain-containing protein [Candidatus Eremiobacteraeota bacterium]|nr:STAS domain-containing protein [Candidatus Eremiobacteraeota bacterium]
MQRDTVSRLLNVSVEVSDGIPVVRVVGELDISTAPQLDEALTSVWQGDPFSTIVVMNQCTYCDSSGMGILLKHAQHVPNLIVVAPADSFPRKVFHVARVEDRLGVVETLGEAFRNAELLRGQL